MTSLALDRAAIAATVEQSIAGDELAFSRIVAAYHLDLVRVAFATCGDEGLAEAGDRWEVVVDAGDGGTMPGAPKVYDPVNRRLIVAGPGIGVDGDLVAVDLVTREWTVLLETR